MPRRRVWKPFFSTSCSDVNFQFFDKDNEDVLVGSIQAHKFLLSLVSPVFKQQFFGALASFEQEVEVVKIEDCSHEAFKLMIELIYDDPYDKQEKALLCRGDFGLLFELLRLADKYQIEGLSDLVKSRLETVPVFVTNALKVLEITEQYKDLLNFEATCFALSIRVARAVYTSWKSSADVLNFWSLNKSKIELINVLFEKCSLFAVVGFFNNQALNKTSVFSSFSTNQALNTTSGFSSFSTNQALNTTPRIRNFKLKSVDYQKIVEHLNKDSTEEKFHVVEFKILDQDGKVESIRANKLLLALVSFSFRSSFYGVSSVKNKKDEVHVLTVENFPPKEFKTMINFIHESKDENIKTEVGKMDLNSLLVLQTLFNKHFLAGFSEIVKFRISQISLSAKNAIEVLSVIKRYEKDSNLASTCIALKQRLTRAVNSWSSPADVLNFWSANRNNIDLVSEMFDSCVIANKNITPVPPVQSMFTFP